MLNVINDTLAWSAPIREGPSWDPWVQFDFLTIRTITKVLLGNLEETRAPVEVRVDYGSSPTTLEEGETIEVIRNELKFTRAVRARIIRLVIVVTNDVTPSLKPITMNSLKFIGCPLEQTQHKSKIQTSARKPLRQKKSQYCAKKPFYQPRHFAVDTINGMIVYVCDETMYRDQGMTCYSSSDQGKTWTALPNYVQQILGFSLVRGRMYLQDKSGSSILSSVDGRRLDVVHDSSLPDMTGRHWKPSLVVEGDGEKMAGVTWVGTSVVGGYGGISIGGSNTLDWASCCRI